MCSLPTEERRNDRHESSSCAELQDGFVHETPAVLMSLEVVTESQSLEATSQLQSVFTSSVRTFQSRARAQCRLDSIRAVVLVSGPVCGVHEQDLKVKVW